MKRRQFIQTIAGSALLLVPAVAYTGQIMDEIAKSGRIADDWSIDYSGNIRYIGADDKTCTIQELYDYIQSQPEGDELMAFEHEILTLDSPLNIDDAGAEHLRSGSIVQTGKDGKQEIYSSFTTIGTVDESQISFHQSSTC